MTAVDRPTSSRPTTCAASTRDQIDEDVAYRVGARVRARARRPARRTADGTACAWRSATTCASTPPRSREPFARGLVDEGCDVLDIGMVGTEMVYYAVGSRELDGGVSVTASHNPKQWAGFKLVREGALALSGDRGIQDVRRVVESEDFSAPRGQGIGRARATSTRSSSSHVLGFIDPEAIRPDGGGARRRQRHGRADDRAARSTRSRSTGERLYFEPNGEFPGHEPNPLLRGEPQADHRHGARARGRAGHRLGRRRGPLLLHRRPGRVRAGRLPHRAAGGGDPRQGARRHDPLRRARQPRRARDRRAAGRQARS